MKTIHRLALAGHRVVRTLTSRTANDVRSLPHPVCESLETRQLLAVTAVELLDPTGPVEQLVASGDQVFFFAKTGSGGSNYQIWRSFGTPASTELMLDATTSSIAVSSLDDLVIADNGNVFFTASSSGGRQLFRLDTRNRKAVQLTSNVNAFYSGIVDANGKTFVLNQQTVYHTDGTAEGTIAIEDFNTNGQLYAGNGVVYFLQNGNDASLWRLTDTPGSAELLGVDVTTRNFFAGDDFFFSTNDGNAVKSYRAGASGPAVQIGRDGLEIREGGGARLGDYAYFSGSDETDALFIELYRVNVINGNVEIVADIVDGLSGGQPTNIAAVSNSIYFDAYTEDYISSQGLYDRDLFRYDVATDTLTNLTDDTLFVAYTAGSGAGTGQGAAVLTDYYFLAAPNENEARTGNRQLYRTNPLTNDFEQIEVPQTTDSNGNVLAAIGELVAGTSGLYFNPSVNPWATREARPYFVSSPFSRLDGPKRTLYAQATAAADYMEIDLNGSVLRLTLNGRQETYDAADVGRIEVQLGDGADTFISYPTNTIDMYVFGDLGDDTIVGGGGNDTLTSGAGRNRMFGGFGNDKLNGSNGRDFLRGEDGDDRLYGKGGNDDLAGGGGVDRLFGDELDGQQGDDFLKGGSSNDKLYGRGGNDTLVGEGQDDLMFGGDGNDLLVGNAGRDTLDGQEGDDTAEIDDLDSVLNIESFI